jgi:hypothetical protein
MIIKAHNKHKKLSGLLFLTLNFGILLGMIKQALITVLNHLLFLI